MPQAAGAGMPQSARARVHVRLPRLTLNSDGRRHPVENVLSVFTLVAGVAALAFGFLADTRGVAAWAHVAAAWLGLAALGIGLYSQLVSATRQERMLIVTGLVAAFVGVSLGLAHGGLLP